MNAEKKPGPTQSQLATVDTIAGWTVDTSHPGGVTALCHAHSDHMLYCTPDWDGPGMIAFQLEHGGYFIEIDSAIPEALTAVQWTGDADRDVRMWAAHVETVLAALLARGIMKRPTD